MTGNIKGEGKANKRRQCDSLDKDSSLTKQAYVQGLSSKFQDSERFRSQRKRETEAEFDTDQWKCKDGIQEKWNFLLDVWDVSLDHVHYGRLNKRYQHESWNYINWLVHAMRTIHTSSLTSNSKLQHNFVDRWWAGRTWLQSSILTLRDKVSQVPFLNEDRMTH